RPERGKRREHGRQHERSGPADSAAATAMLRRWAGVPATLAKPLAADLPLDDGLGDRRRIR
ncbi:hypothetical protein, partial [Actinoplanes philippinensis]|uniref:hypothetical protein n=1 Tax=Actinoplanes philippinensis TaxID=35752 RepID=UPI0034081ED4